MRKLRVGLSSASYAPYAALQLASERGYFAGGGIAVDLLPQLGGGRNQEAFEAREVEIAHVNPSNVELARRRGVSQVGFAAMTDRPYGYHVLVPAASAVRSISDLDGATIAASAAGSSTAIYAQWAARKAGIHLRVEMVGADGLVRALESARVAAILVWPLLSYALMHDGRGRSILNVAAGLGPNVPACWTASREAVAAEPQVLRAFLDGIARAVRDLQRDRAFAIPYIARFLKDIEEPVIAAGFDEVIGGLDPDSRVSREALGTALQASVEAGALDFAPDLESVFSWKILDRREHGPVVD